MVDRRAAWADGEPSFTEGGFGRSRYGGGAAGGSSAKLQVADAAIEWTPRIGWAWRYPLSKWFDLRFEALLIDSPRPSRALAGEAAAQSQMVLQSSLRLSL